jgi:DNA-binding NarL/FixJ family response regulator
MSNQITVGIVDDNQNLLNQIQENIQILGTVKVIVTANNGQDLLNKLPNLSKLPEVLLMDIEMPIMNGIETTAIVTKETDIKVLILTSFDTDDKVFEAIKAGANGYLLKDSKPHKIITSIEDVVLGGAPMSPQIALKTLELLRNKTNDTETKNEPLNQDLSKREIEILRLLTEGKLYDQIGNLLFISQGTVRKHVQNIYSKLHIHNKVEAINLVNQKRWFK